MSLLNPPAYKPDKSRHGLHHRGANAGRDRRAMVCLSLLPREKSGGTFFRRTTRRRHQPGLSNLEAWLELPDEGFSRRLGTQRLLRPGEELQDHRRKGTSCIKCDCRIVEISPLADARDLIRKKSKDQSRRAMDSGGRQIFQLPVPAPDQFRIIRAEPASSK